MGSYGIKSTKNMSEFVFKLGKKYGQFKQYSFVGFFFLFTILIILAYAADWIHKCRITG